MSFELNILGAVEARQQGQEIPLGPPQRRAVLALLAVAPGRSLSVADLMEALWEDSPPSTASTALQVHIHHLRKCLAEADDGHSGPVLRTRRSPVASAVRYELQLAAGATDIERYRLLQLQVSAAKDHGDHRRAQEAWAQAHALWRGEPLQGLPATSTVRALRLALEQGLTRPHDLAAIAAQTRSTAALLPAASDPPVHSAEAAAARPEQVYVTPRSSSVSAAPSEGRLRFAVLGPVRVWRGDEPIGTGAPQQRALLAALLLRGGRTATASELLHAVWGEHPPNTALAALRSYAFRLRKALGSQTLVTDSGGYALRIDADALDSAVAERLAAEAEKIRRSDPVRARQLLGDALELWHGEPLAGLPGPYAETQRSRLAEWRLGLIETRLDLDLELGAHAEAVSELTALSAEHPLRERIRALLMLALFRSGRQAEALGVYADTRRLLADELGIYPSAELTDLHQRILEADASLNDPGADDARPDGPTGPRPAQLPATVPDFTGREAFVRELGAQLREASQGGGIMAVSAVAGISGVGKTTLAVHVAHEARDAFPDGQLYVDLQGKSQNPADPGDVLSSFLSSLGTPGVAIPENFADKAALFRSTLYGRRVLVVLDNAHDAAQVRQLLPGTPGCAALVTSRVRMVDLAGAHLVDLDAMSPQEALQLFARIVGEERTRIERQAALDVVGACGFLPLAIRIAAARLAARRSWTVSMLAHRLANHRRRLDELRAGDLAVKATFALGYDHLSPAQARAFRLLSLPDSPDISLTGAAALLDLDPYETEELLEALVDVNLIESTAPVRYRYNDLLHLYARECAERDETPEERRQALSRLLDFYLASAAGSYELENPGDRVLEHLAPTARSGVAFTGREEALEWLFSEGQNLLAAVEQVAGIRDESMHRRAVDLLLAAWDLMESGTYGRQYQQAARALVTAAHDHADALVEGRGRVLLAQSHRIAGDFTAARQEAERARALGRTSGDPVTGAYSANVLGVTAFAERRYEESAALLTTALEAFRADRNKHGEASALANLGRAQLNLGDPAAAVATCRQVLAIHRELDSSRGLANGLYTLSIPLSATGRLDEALDCLTEALTIFRDARRQFWEGMTLYRLAEVHQAAGRWRECASSAEHALVLLHQVGGKWRTANALTVLGRALARLDQPVRAHACWRDALGIYTALGSPEADEVRELLGRETPSPVAK